MVEDIHPRRREQPPAWSALIAKFLAYLGEELFTSLD